MRWIYGGVNIKLPKGTKVTQKIYVDCAKANWTPGEKPWVNALCLHGCPDGSPIPAASTLSRVNRGRQSWFHHGEVGEPAGEKGYNCGGDLGL